MSQQGFQSRVVLLSIVTYISMLVISRSSLSLRHKMARCFTIRSPDRKHIRPNARG